MTVIGFPAIGSGSAIPPESLIADPALDDSLDATRFQSGFDDASNHLATLPIPWARQHAREVLARRRTADDEPSYTRGYRAALYGFLRCTSR